MPEKIIDQNLLNLIMDLSPASVAVFDTEMKYLMVSQRWLDDYGLQNQNVIGKSHYDVFPEIPQRWKDIHKECLLGKVRKAERDIFPREDGKMDYVTWEVRPWYNDANQLSGIVMLTEVVTKLVEAETKLSQQIKIQEMMIKNIPDFSIVMFDHDLRIILVGGDTLRKNHVDVANIEGKPLKDVVRDETYNALYPYYRKTLNGETFFFERRPPHTGQTLHSYANPVLDANGDVIAGLIATQDVTNIEHTQKLLEFKEAQFRAIFDNTFQFMGFMDTDGTLLEINKATLEFVGVTKEDVIGKPLWEMTWWVYPTDVQETLKQAIQKAKNGELIRYETQVVGTNDEILTIDFSIKPMFDDTGKVIQLIPEGWDISDLIKLQQELQQSNQDLEKFAYIASHDLQEPLRMVTSFLDLLQVEYAGQLSDEADQYINFAVDGAQRMKHLIQDLLDYSRVTTKLSTFHPINMNQVLENVLLNLSVVIRETQAEIICDTPLPILKGDEAQITRLLQNLIGNAIKFHKPNQIPRITITIEDMKNHWQFAIQDNGIGIKDKYFEQIFIIFQRLHTQNTYSGTGIGLAICKKILSCHNGDIWVKSKLGDGSTFFFTFPKAT